MTHSFLPRLSALALALTLAGCSLAPKYERPALPIQAEFPSYSKAAVSDSQDDFEQLGLQEFFKDPQLQALIALALDHNRDLRIAVDRVEEARAQFGITRADQFPSIGAGANGQVTRYPENMRTQGPDSPSVSKSFQLGVGLTSFELDFFGRLRNLSEAAFQQYLSTEQAQRAVRINVVAQVAEAYFKLRSAQELQRLMVNTEKSRAETFRLVQRSFDVGTTSELDLNQARLQLETVRADREQARRNELRAENALTLLIGTELPADLPQAATFGPTQLVQQIPTGLASELLERRPDIIAAEHALKAAKANIGAARAAFFPRISLTGLLGFASPSLSSLVGSSHRFWQYSPEITMPIFTGGSVRSALAVAEARDNIAVAQYEQSIQNAFAEVADALAGEATYAEQLQAVAKMIKSAQRSTDLATLRYETGIDSFLQVQTAEVNLYSAQQVGIQVGLESLLNRIELYKALGGGWGIDPLVSDQNNSSTQERLNPATE
ncbi:MAG TPA: efflux transporter outer membrane subunit [Candidatus Paenalcaligenes intestinipullorum]|uniref:Efflux transporter outer membrane subunit n=1 Tax=Candidatus Paenalcaligenes intestinipullorum TaxID=2838718 RepID=A0A9D2RJ04_9BURK|nr:efflux transporter outer membrane subunit [Candidatus Paenalcaligenes intestinipullorum]